MRRRRISERDTCAVVERVSDAGFDMHAKVNLRPVTDDALSSNRACGTAIPWGWNLTLLTHAPGGERVTPTRNTPVSARGTQANQGQPLISQCCACLTTTYSVEDRAPLVAYNIILMDIVIGAGQLSCSDGRHACYSLDENGE